MLQVRDLDVRLPTGLSIEECVCLAAATQNGGRISADDLAPLCNTVENPKVWANRTLRILAMKGFVERDGEELSVYRLPAPANQ